EAVRSILRKVGLDEAALQCGVHAPYHRPTAQALRRRGAEPTALHNNCSGKHAGMLALAVQLGAPVSTYVEVDHPVQVRIRAAIEELAGLDPGSSRVATDGCSAPTFAMPLRHAARMYARLVQEGRRGPMDAAAARVVAAMRRHPEMVAGTDRLCTELMRAGGGGLGWRRDDAGVGAALKIADGDGLRARPSAAIEALLQMGLLDRPVAAALVARFAPDLKNRRGLPVGRVEPVFDLGAPPSRAAK